MKIRVCLLALIITGHYAVADSTEPIIKMLNRIDHENKTDKLKCSGGTSVVRFSGPVLPSMCLKRDKFFRDVVGKTMSTQEAVQWLSDQNAKVIILGENHYSPTLDFLPNLIGELISKNKNINCLFFEEPSKLENSSEEMKADSKALDYYYSWKKSADVAVKMGVKVYFIDNRNYPEELQKALAYTDDNEARAKGLEFRNQQMSARISHLISTGACKAGVAVNGKDHLFENFKENKYHSLQSLVRAQGLSTRTVNLQDVFRPDFEKPIDPKNGTFHRSSTDDWSWNWKECPRNPHPGKEKVAFSNKTGGQVPFSHRGHQDEVSGYWSDFDLTILLP